MDPPRTSELVCSPRGGKAIKTVAIIGLDIANHVFQVHGEDAMGKSRHTEAQIMLR